MLLRSFGVYAPQGDTALLLSALSQFGVRPGSRALDVGTGSGTVALSVAGAGAAEVWAVDVSRRAALTARLNAFLHRRRLTVRRGDFGECAGQGRFDLVTANPPYVPSRCGALQARGVARAWDAGPRGRDVLDRLCAAMPRLLAPGGTLLLVHSALCGVAATLTGLRAEGLDASVVARRAQPFGPVLLRRARWLEEQGLIAAGQRHEELVVVRADLPGAPGGRAAVPAERAAGGAAGMRRPGGAG
ncbi:HemK2/MTQ2 family protein methyltransferase [Streptomyces hoynatensis]|nr:HemK2/MTQ2 family protein methyltransferase [Streptomyces hoynatensis]